MASQSYKIFRRKKKTVRGNVDFDALVQAVKSMYIEKRSARSTAVLYKISRTSLIRYYEKLLEKVPDLSVVSDDAIVDRLKKIATYSRPQIFNLEQEKLLIRYISKCSEIYFGVPPKEVKWLAYNFAVKMGIKYPTSWDKYGSAGREWLTFFLDRNRDLGVRKQAPTATPRRDIFSKERVEAFFALFGSKFDKIENDPSRLWNLEEAGFTTENRPNRVHTLRGMRQLFLNSTDKGSNVSLALAVNADGNRIPPFFVFPRSKMRQSLLNLGPSGADGAAAQDGWMQQEQFLKFVVHFLNNTGCSKSRPMILIIDNYDSHLSIEALDMAEENGLIITSIPPRTSHKMQPFDVSVYEPLRNAFNEQSKEWIKNNAGRALEIHHIPLIADKAIELAVTRANITKGFRETGIYPLNPDIFSEDDFETSEPSPSTVKSDLENDLEKERDTESLENNACQVWVKSEVDIE